MFDLPDVAPYRLARAPLAQALAQVRYPLQARLGTLEGVALMQERLANRYPYLEPATAAGGIEVQFGPAGAQAALSPSASHYIFKSDDGYSVWLAPDSATLSVGDAYMGAADFRERFLELLTVLGSVGRIPRCDRIAARYLTLATMPPGEPEAWTSWFRHEVTGWQGQGHLAEGAAIASSIAQTELIARPSGKLADFPADVAALVRHGLIPEGSTVNGMPAVPVQARSFVIDADVFCAAAQPWDASRLERQFSALHGQIDRFFRWTLTADGERYFGYEEVQQ